MPILTDIPPGQTEMSADAGPANAYDAVPYSVCAFPQTRPDRLAVIATLFGMSPAPPANCRVLELGCASGGNVIPLALAHPRSQFVGIDLSRRQIEDGQRVASELGLSNLQLHATSILDVGQELGVFDYVLAHGVYSWVPPDVQDKILDICSRQLAPQGVGYVSYNAYPGWHARGAIREMLWYHVQQLDDPAARIRAARELMKFLAASTAPRAHAATDRRPLVAADAGYGSLIQQELTLLERVPDSYLLHEHLEEFNEPLYFHQFVERAADKGLQYLAESQISAMVASRFGPEIESALRRISPDLLHLEQYMDFLRNRMFRQTLLCHAGVKLEHALRPEVVKSLFIGSSAQPVSPSVQLSGDRAEEFRGRGQTTFTTRDPLMKSAMACLGESWPVPMKFADLFSAARERLSAAGFCLGDTDDDVAAARLAARLLNCHVSDLVEFSASAPCFTVAVTDRPMANPYARLRAGDGGPIVNYRLESILMGEPSRLVLSHLDGRHDTSSLVALVAQWMRKASAPPTAAESPPDSIDDRAAKYVGLLLRGFARNALLEC